MCLILPFTGVLIVYIPIDLEKLFVQLRKLQIVFTFDKNISILNVIGNGILFEHDRYIFVKLSELVF